MKLQDVAAEALCSQPCCPSDYLESLENPGLLTYPVACGNGTVWGVTCYLSLMPEHSLSRGRKDCDMRCSLL